MTERLLVTVDMLSEGSDTITIQLNDGTDVECDVVSIFTVDEILERRFIALNPLQQSSFGNIDEIQLFAINDQNHNMGFELAMIDEDIFDTVLSEFFRLLEE